MRADQIERIKSGRGFIAALDQSGGSTPKTLKLYGLDESKYHNDEEMFDLVHQMRSRIIASPVFDHHRILAVILFEKTMERKIDGIHSAEYLWKVKGIPSFLKVDNGLREESDGVQLMKEIPQLGKRISEALSHGILGTKMRSVIKSANVLGIEKVLDQQFEYAETILASDLIPIIEPEVDINSSEKRVIEGLLLDRLKDKLDALPEDAKVVLKLTLPEENNLYKGLLSHRAVLRIAALSGGYSRSEANQRLSQNEGVIASFSRALTEGLTAKQSEDDFNEALDKSIESIYRASI